MNEAVVLDGAVLDDLTGHIGAEAVRAIIEMFVGECRELAATIGTATSATAAGRAAHSLKSSAGQLGAVSLAAAALDVETAAESNAAALPQLIAGLLDCAARTESALVARLAG